MENGFGVNSEENKRHDVEVVEWKKTGFWFVEM
jgi:hypothetical protein